MAFATSLPPAITCTSSRLPYSKKRPFLLLEILISILLISICLIPLIQSPIRSYRAELFLLEEMEGERLAEWSFSEIKEKLINHEIPWDKLPSPEEATAPIYLPSITIKIPGSAPKKIERSFVLKCHKKGEKTGVHGEVYKMLKIEISFSPQLTQKKHAKEKGDYSYRLVVQKLPRDIHNFDKDL